MVTNKANNLVRSDHITSTLLKDICTAHLYLNCLDTLCFIQDFILISHKAQQPIPLPLNPNTACYLVVKQLMQYVLDNYLD